MLRMTMTLVSRVQYSSGGHLPDVQQPTQKTTMTVSKVPQAFGLPNLDLRQPLQLRRPLSTREMGSSEAPLRWHTSVCQNVLFSVSESDWNAQGE
jgi:hypothetical protein